MTLRNRSRLFSYQRLIRIRDSNTVKINKSKKLKWVSKKRRKKLNKALANIETFRNSRQSWRRNPAQSERTIHLNTKWRGHHCQNAWLQQLRQHTIKIRKPRCSTNSKNQHIQERVVHEKIEITNKSGFRPQPNLTTMWDLRVMSQTASGYPLPAWPHNSKSHNYSRKSCWSLLRDSTPSNHNITKNPNQHTLDPKRLKLIMKRRRDKSRP